MSSDRDRLYPALLERTQMPQIACAAAIPAAAIRAVEDLGLTARTGAPI
jgi:hypothetical protein